jgi:hypothetical protein
MRRELSWALVATAALTMGTIGAEPYARLLTPYYIAVSRLLARGHPWDIAGVDISSDAKGPGSVLRLTAFVRRYEADRQPVGQIVSKLQVAAAAESPVVFWTVLLLWPVGSIRRRIGVLVLGIPIFLGLEAATTVCQLLNPLAYGSALLVGNASPLTWWERWSRFVESGGRIALAATAAILTVTAVRTVTGAGTAPRVAHQ